MKIEIMSSIVFKRVMKLEIIEEENLPKSIQTCGKQRTFFLISGSLKIFKKKNILRQMKKKSTTVLNLQGGEKTILREVYSKGVCRTKKNLSSLTSNNTEITKDNKIT